MSNKKKDNKTDHIVDYVEDMNGNKIKVGDVIYSSYLPAYITISLDRSCELKYKVIDISKKSYPVLKENSPRYGWVIVTDGKKNIKLSSHLIKLVKTEKESELKHYKDALGKDLFKGSVVALNKDLAPSKDAVEVSKLRFNVCELCTNELATDFKGLSYIKIRDEFGEYRVPSSFVRLVDNACDGVELDTKCGLTPDTKIDDKNISIKNDIIDDKLRWDLLPLKEIEDIVRVYSAGAKKYGPNRWQGLEDGMNRYKAALLRHLAEFDKGERIDADTGCYHLAQVAWNAIAMLYLDKKK